MSNVIKIGLMTQLDPNIKDIYDMIVFVHESLSARMDRLEVRMDRLEARMDRLEMRMDRLEERMDNLEIRMSTLENNFERHLNDCVTKFRFDDLKDRVKYVENKLGIESGA